MLVDKKTAVLFWAGSLLMLQLGPPHMREPRAFSTYIEKLKRTSMSEIVSKRDLGKYFWFSSLILMHQLDQDKIKPGALEELKQNYEHMRVSFQEVFPDVDWKLVETKESFDFWVDGVKFFEYVEQNNVSEAASILKTFYNLVGL